MNILKTLLIAGLLFSIPSLSTAQIVCGKREVIIKSIGEKYGEVRRGAGLVGSTEIFEIYASETGSWTILRTTPNGLTCVMAAGENWQEYHPEPISGRKS